jgi:hypothetical protein
LRGPDATGPVLLRGDSAYYGHAVVNAAARAGADVSVTVRQDKRVKAAIAGGCQIARVNGSLRQEAVRFRKGDSHDDSEDEDGCRGRSAGAS